MNKAFHEIRIGGKNRQNTKKEGRKDQHSKYEKPAFTKKILSWVLRTFALLGSIQAFGFVSNEQHIASINKY
jgi:hypothetical protein